MVSKSRCSISPCHQLREGPTSTGCGSCLVPATVGVQGRLRRLRLALPCRPRVLSASPWPFATCAPSAPEAPPCPQHSSQGDCWLLQAVLSSGNVHVTLFQTCGLRASSPAPSPSSSQVLSAAHHFNFDDVVWIDFTPCTSDSKNSLPSPGSQGVSPKTCLLLIHIHDPFSGSFQRPRGIVAEVRPRACRRPAPSGDSVWLYSGFSPVFH